MISLKSFTIRFGRLELSIAVSKHGLREHGRGNISNPTLAGRVGVQRGCCYSSSLRGSLRPHHDAIANEGKGAELEQQTCYARYSALWPRMHVFCLGKTVVDGQVGT
jgi:hypothetical protein